MSEGKRVSDKLLFQIRQVAVQYQNTRLLQSWMRYGLVTILLLIAAVCMFNWFDIDGWAKVYTIAGFGLAEIILFVFMVVIPVNKPVSDEQIALHIEEYYPDLENRIISAQEFTKQNHEDHTWMIEKFFKESKDLTHKISFYDVIDSDQLIKFMMITACFALIIAALFTGTYSLWVPHFPAAVNTVVQTFVDIDGFNVEPGDVRIKQGESQIVIVEAEDEMKTTAIRWRKPDQENWETAVMEANANQNAAYHQFGKVQSELEYQVVFGDQTSDVFTIETWLPPKVESIDLTYTYPEYLNREQKVVPNSGEITGIEGTEVKIDVWVNKDLASTVMVYDEDNSLALAEAEDVLWSATFVLQDNGEYHIALLDDEGNENEIKINYKITVESDDPPEFSVTFPRDDMEVSMLEDVPFEISFADDYGLQDYGIQYEIAGQDAIRLSLKEAGHDSHNVEINYRLALEMLEVQPGDLITWNAWAEDQMPNRNEYDTYGDPFFIEIRPYRRLFKESMTNAGAQQQQQQQQEQQQQQQQEQERDQKQIIIALWNLRKGFKDMTDEEFIELRDALHEAQTGVMQQAAENAQSDSPHFNPMMDAMNNVLVELETMELPDPDDPLNISIKEAQKAHHRMIVMQPEEAEVQQSRQQQGGGGGGGGGQQNQLSELNELEMNRERNFYEEENRTSSQQMEETNNALDKLQELTQRQKSLNEEIAKLISEIQNEKDIEELERQLERLREEQRNNLDSLDQLQSELAQSNQNTEEMRQAEQEMDQAREQMNDTLSQLNEDQLQEARTSGSRAVSALNNMEDSLENLSRDAAEQRMRRLQDQMQEIVDMQNDVIEQINEIEDSQERSNGSLSDTSNENKEEIMQTKNELAEAFQELMEDATELSERSTESQELMSQKLGDWLRQTSQKGIMEDIQEENQMPLLKYGIYDKALEREEALAEKIASAAQDLKEAADFMVEDDLEGMRRALAEMKELLDNQSQSMPGNVNVGDSSRAIAMGPNSDDEQQSQQGQSQQGQGQQGQGQQGQGQQGQDQQGQGQQGQGQQGQGQQGQGQQGQGQQGQGQQGQGQQGQDQQGQGQQGQGQQGQGQQGQGQQGQGQQGQGRGGGNRQGGDGFRNNGSWNGGGGWDNSVAPFEDFMPNIAEADLGQFMEEGYRDWLDSLRNAEGLLNDNEQFRDDVMRIREEIEEMRREYRDEYSLPKYDLFIEKVAKPLAITTAELQREINEMLKDQEVYIADEGSVPYRYEKSVAEYFKQLSEAETVQ